MGLIKLSLLILFVAISTPLLYKRFANDDTIKFMSKYHSDYKKVDQFLRQTASHIEKAKDYVPESNHVRDFITDVQKKVEELFIVLKKNIELYSGRKNDNSNEANKPKPTSTPDLRLTDCPGEKNRVRLWSKSDLSHYDGSSSSGLIYLGFLGLVYNVTLNSQHYGPNGEYNVFSGRDATRAFITGNFTHDLTDDVRDLEESFYSHIDSWTQFYESTYESMGRIIGAFYDDRGCGTQELARVRGVIQKLNDQRARYNEQSKSLPECNSEWNTDTRSGRVWCTPKSGGIERDWAGVPRLLEDDNESTGSRCVCVNLATLDQAQKDVFKVYADCDPDASECPLKA